MHAMTFATYGGPDVLHLGDLPIPVPGPTQVRVATRRAGVNPIDVKLRSGALQDLQPRDLPTVPGSEIAGIVDCVGAEVEAITVGDEVFGWSTTGAYAEYALATVVARKPPEMGWDRAASLPVAGEAALRALRILDVRQGESLLIHGVGGNVGTIAAQLAVAAGATVFGTARHEHHADLRAIGVVPIVAGPGWALAVKSLVPYGITKILDAAGAGLLPESVELVDGDQSRVLTLADPAAFALGVTFAAGGADDLTTAVLARLTAASSSLRLPDPRLYRLEHAGAAQAAVAAGGVRGKTLMEVGQ